MWHNILTWLKNIAEGWKIFFGLVGMVVAIGTVAIKIDHWKTKKSSDSEIIAYLQKDKILRDKKEHIQDSIDIEFRKSVNQRLDWFSDSISLTIINTSKITNSFATWVRKNSHTVDDFVNAVNGLEFTLVQPVNKSTYDKNPDLKIIIQKKTKP